MRKNLGDAAIIINEAARKNKDGSLIVDVANPSNPDLDRFDISKVKKDRENDTGSAPFDAEAETRKAIITKLNLPLTEVLDADVAEYLKQKSIKFIGDLVQQDRDDMYATIRNFSGWNNAIPTFTKIERTLTSHGLKIGLKIPWWVRPQTR